MLKLMSKKIYRILCLKILFMFFYYRSVDHIWDHVQDKHTHVALVFEEEDSYIGRKVSNHEVLFTYVQITKFKSVRVNFDCLNSGLRKSSAFTFLLYGPFIRLLLGSIEKAYVFIST